MSHFLGWGAGRGQVGVKRVRGGGKVGWGGLDVFDKGSHFFDAKMQTLDFSAM